MKNIFCVGAILLPLLFLGQQPQPKSLAVGDPVPFEILSGILGVDKLNTFNEDKEKIVLLDFWATWCTSCIYNFPKLDSMQQQFSGRLQVVLVNSISTGDDEKKITAFFEKRKKYRGKTYNLPVIFNDTVFSKWFPHKYIPHYVWIKDRTVIAITGSEEVSAKNITEILQGKTVKLKIKKDDFDFDTRQPLFVNGNGGSGQEIKFRSILTGKIDGLPPGQSLESNGGKQLTRISFRNQPLLQLFTYAYAFFKPVNRMVLPPDSPSPFLDIYTYELIVPPQPPAYINKLMQQDLQRFFGYTGHYKKTKQTCWVLSLNKKVPGLFVNKHPAHNNLFDKDAMVKEMTSTPVSTLVNYLNTVLPAPLIDETGTTQKMSLSFNATGIKDAAILKKDLAKYGLSLKKEERTIEMFYITKHTPSAVEPTPTKRW